MKELLNVFLNQGIGINKMGLNYQKHLKERVQDVSKVYTDNQLNISNFLNWSMHPKMQKMKKKRKKSDGKIGKNDYKTSSGKSNSRSQSR